MLLISDFNLQNLVALLTRHESELGSPCRLAPSGQVSQTLLVADSPVWQPAPQICLVWTRPESVLPSFQRVLAGHPVSLGELDRDVDEFVHCLSQAARRVPILLVPTWSLPPYHLGHGLLDTHRTEGPARLLMQANLRLLAALDAEPSVHPLHADRWLHFAGKDSFSPRLWYGAKIPFNNEVFKFAATDMLAAVRGLRGRARKLVLLDLDDTLWGGVVGDVGWENLVLGGHDPAGEALVDFQHALKALSRQGVALGILSKNQEHVALEAIRLHPEMVLRVDDFAGWRINWDDKAKNLAALVRELNLGTDSVVFIDDSPAERARVREAFPDVLVPEWPQDKRFYAQSLLALDCFQKPSLSEEDRQRAQMYADDRRRTEVRNSLTSLDEWLATLRLSVTAQPLGRVDLTRITQLLNKTNQMNLSTRRLTEQELLTWTSCSGRSLLGLRVADRFGDYGLAGILGLETDDSHTARIVDFVLSCRVMGRCVEETMLHLAVEWARAQKLTLVQAQYQSTAKNRPCLDFFQRSGFVEPAPNIFSWDARQSYALPQHIHFSLATGNSAPVNSVPAGIQPQPA